MASLTQKQQLFQFQNYLQKQKVTVLKNLQSKIFPKTDYGDYNFLQLLGHGSYGQVLAAQNIHSKKIVAVKIIKKRKLVQKEILSHLLWEIRVMSAINFEFLISLECYFTNKCAVFLVMPYVNGGHFFRFLRKVKRLEESVARFFAGQVILAIEYLHYMGIVYRDLKPENLLLDLQGYLKVVDYGFAKYIGPKQSYTFCGTPEYLAPEILLSKAYSMSPDWWTLGILLYEMCNGSPPFTSKNELKLFEKILAGHIKWPEHFSRELKSLVDGLLQVDTSKRFGCKKNQAQDIKLHSWFSSLDWNALWNKNILSPAKLPEFGHNNEITVSRIHDSFTNCKNYIPNDMIRNIDFAV